MQRRMKLRKSLDRGSHRNGRNATRDRDGCIRMRMTILYEDGPDETTSERNARWKTLKLKQRTFVECARHRIVTVCRMSAYGHCRK
jgi:hypothetical protein